MARRGLVTCALMVLLVASLALVGASAQAVPSRDLVVAPAGTSAGQPVTVTGTSSQRHRQRVALQVRGADGAWRTQVRKRSTARGAFAFVVPTPETSTTYRALGARLPDGRRWRSRPVTVVPVTVTTPPPVVSTPPVATPAPVLRVVAPTEARAGEPVVVTTVVTPALAGQVVDLVVDGQAVASGPQDAAGRAVTTVAAPAAGTHTVTARTGGGEARSVTLRTMPAVTGIPRVTITTDDGQDITSHDTYARARMVVDPRGSGVPAYDASARFRVRGNYTSFVSLKRPYKIKLDASTPLVGLPRSKDWVLLANFFDRSLLRTELGMETGRRMGLAWSPRFVDAEVYVNGRFQGLYQLGEGIEVDDDRLDLDLDATDASRGGYLLEADSYDDADPRFRTTRGLQVFVKQPGGLDQAYVDAVAGHVQAFEDALYAPDFADRSGGYRDLIDVGSFVDWYLAMELTSNIDAGMKNSVYLYRPVGGRLTMGPVWDFDISAGFSRRWSHEEPTGWWVGRNWYGDGADGVPSQMQGPEGHWFVRLLQDPAFVEAVRARWQEVRASLLTLPAHLQARRELIADAVVRNFAPHEEGGAGMFLGPSILDSDSDYRHWPTYAAGTDFLDTWLRTRLAWMDDQLG